MINTNYFSQVALLVKVLPYVMMEEKFCLKGGTAINLFVRNMPRLSVDIDLTYLPIESREQTLDYIDKAFERIASRIETKITSTRCNIIKSRDGHAKQIIVSKGNIKIKIEINNVLRGAVFPCKIMDLCENAQNKFEFFTSARILSFEDLYAGKICAALDRQHPRDLFDIKILLNNEGISDELRKAFIIYLISNNRPIVELLNPNLLDIRSIYNDELDGMSDNIPACEQLVETRKSLIDIIKNNLTNTEKEFLLSFKNAEPNWSLLSLENIDKLPAIAWKLNNIQKMDKKKHTIILTKLKTVLEI